MYCTFIVNSFKEGSSAVTVHILFFAKTLYKLVGTYKLSGLASILFGWIPIVFLCAPPLQYPVLLKGGYIPSPSMCRETYIFPTVIQI